MGHEARLITSIDELQKEVAWAHQLGKTSDEAMRDHFETFRFELPTTSDCPFSPSFRDQVLAQYEDLAGRAHHVDNEFALIDFDAALSRPYPYNANSAGLTADYFSMIANMLRVLDRTSGTVADMGAGWGHTSEILAAQGMDVYALDMNADFCRLIEARSAGHGLKVNTINGDFFAVEQAPELDAAVFFESFHHCLDHVKLLKLLRGKIRSGGTIVFAAEPVYLSWRAPWGLRLDGMALWSIRQCGWLELGFEEDYFLEALLRTGWSPERFDHPGWYPTYRATKVDEYLPARIMWPTSCGWSGEECDPALDHRFTGKKTVIPFPEGPATIVLSNIRGSAVTSTINGIPHVIWPGEQASVATTSTGRITIETDTWLPAEEFGNNDARALGVAVHSIRIG